MATSRQMQAIAIYMENRGSISVGEAMRRAGYSDATAKNPKQLTSSMGWQEAMEHFLPDIDLLSKHHQLMNAKTIVRADFPIWVPQERIRAIIQEAGCEPRNMETNPFSGQITVWYWAPDTSAQTKALELAYKLKKKMGPDLNVNIVPPTALVEFLGGESTTPGQDSVS